MGRDAVTEITEPHAYLGSAEEATFPARNGVCQRYGCGKLRLAKVHAGFEPRFANESKTLPVLESWRGRPVQASDTIPAVAAWDAFSAQVRDTIVRKSQGYGNAWQEQGYMGSVARILSKAARIKNLVWREPNIDFKEEESAQDTLVDLAALCAFATANMEESNQWGR